MLISIIIATCNRVGLLSAMLDSFFQQEFDPSILYELVIVDNNSTDNTRAYINSLIKQKGNIIRYILESKKGKTKSLNTGIAAARGDILVFTDDDVLIDKNWLNKIANFSKNNDFDAMGGKVLPIYPEKTPNWIKDCKDLLNGPIVYYDCGDILKRYDSSMLPFIGANFVVKASIFKEGYFFNPDFGPGAGTMGDDTFFYRTLEKQNKAIFYNPDLIVYHPVDHSRMNLGYIAKWNMAMGKYYAKKEINVVGLVKYFRVPRYLILRILKLCALVMLDIFNKRKFIKSWQELFLNLGMIQEYSSNKS